MRGDSDRHLTLAVPGLFGPDAGDDGDPSEAADLLCEGLSLPALERFLARSTRTAVQASDDGLAAMLFGCFGVPRDGPDWPVAAVTRCVDAGDDETRWVLRTDPVHLRAAMGELVLGDSEALRVSMEEAATLAAEINAQLGEPDVKIESLAAKRWYVCLDAPPHLVTRAPWDIVGTPIGASLPGGDDGARWRALVNDIQMILHASPVNRAREARGEPAVNSVWPWGGGYRPRVPGAVWQCAWSDETLVAGLARLNGIPSEMLPGDARGWLGRASPGRHLLVFGTGHAAAVSCDVDRWRRFVADLEEAWFTPLGDAIASGQVASVELRTGGPLDFTLVRRGLRQWWRRTPHFARVIAGNRRAAAQQK